MVRKESYIMEFLLKAIIGGLIIAGVVTAAERGNPNKYVVLNKYIVLYLTLSMDHVIIN
jgi:hypothetical protein